MFLSFRPKAELELVWRRVWVRGSRVCACHVFCLVDEQSQAVFSVSGRWSVYARSSRVWAYPARHMICGRRWGEGGSGFPPSSLATTGTVNSGKTRQSRTGVFYCHIRDNKSQQITGLWGDWSLGSDGSGAARALTGNPDVDDGKYMHKNRKWYFITQVYNSDFRFTSSRTPNGLTPPDKHENTLMWNGQILLQLHHLSSE